MKVEDLIDYVMDAGEESEREDEGNLEVRFRFDVLGIPYTAVYELATAMNHEAHTATDSDRANWLLKVFRGRGDDGEEVFSTHYWISWEDREQAREYVTRPIKEALMSDVADITSSDCGFSVYGTEQGSDLGET